MVPSVDRSTRSLLCVRPRNLVYNYVDNYYSKGHIAGCSAITRRTVTLGHLDVDLRLSEQSGNDRQLQNRNAPGRTFADSPEILLPVVGISP